MYLTLVMTKSTAGLCIYDKERTQGVAKDQGIDQRGAVPVGHGAL